MTEQNPEAAVTLGFDWDRSLAKWTGTAHALHNMQTTALGHIFIVKLKLNKYFSIVTYFNF